MASSLHPFTCPNWATKPVSSAYLRRFDNAAPHNDCPAVPPIHSSIASCQVDGVTGSGAVPLGQRTCTTLGKIPVLVDVPVTDHPTVLHAIMRVCLTHFAVRFSLVQCSLRL